MLLQSIKRNWPVLIFLSVIGYIVTDSWSRLHDAHRRSATPTPHVHKSIYKGVKHGPHDGIDSDSSGSDSSSGSSDGGGVGSRRHKIDPDEAFRIHGNFGHDMWGFNGTESIRTRDLEGDECRLVIFTCPKAFRGNVLDNQYNAIRSWLEMTPPPAAVVVLGDEAGVRDVARKLGLFHIPDVRRNQYGTPLLSDIFNQVQARFDTKHFAYVNSDIFLFDNFIKAQIAVCRQMPEYLMIGKRTNVKMSTHKVDFGHLDWDTRLQRRARLHGELFVDSAQDYFSFTRGLWDPDGVPDFALGRMVWDNWLVKNALMKGASDAEAEAQLHPDNIVVDATAVVLAVHADHDYSHVHSLEQDADHPKSGVDFHGQEKDYNTDLGLMSGYGFYDGFISYSQYVVVDSDAGTGDFVVLKRSEALQREKDRINKRWQELFNKTQTTESS